jgi:hypothetical protein
MLLFVVVDAPIDRVPAPQYQLLGTVESRANMYRERLLLTQQRLLRSELFALKGMGNSTLTTKHKGTNQMVHEVRTVARTVAR